MKNNKCAKCQKPATVYYKETVNGITKETWLCAACAEESGVGKNLFYEPFFHDDLFGSFPFFGGFFPQENPASLTAGESCPTCGATLAKIREDGRFGCGDCYETFGRRIDFTPFVGKGFRGRRLGTSKGEKARETPAKEQTAAEKIASMKKSLKEAVAKENYEKAAELRDEIRRLEA